MKLERLFRKDLRKLEKLKKRIKLRLKKMKSKNLQEREAKSMINSAVKSLEDLVQELTGVASLLQLGLHRVEKLHLPLEEVPATLQCQVEGWPATRHQLLQDRRDRVALVMLGVVKMLARTVQHLTV